MTGTFPTTRFPVLVYEGVVKFNRAFDPAATLEVLLEGCGWGDLWRDGIYPYVHYHSRIHEVPAVASGSASVRIGGNRGRTLKIRSGDVLVLPAGTGHECLRYSSDFLVVGGYPATGVYDECRGSFSERQKSLRSIAKVPVPATDPLFGREGPLRSAWTAPKSREQAASRRK